jgi:hypothetical protein
VDPCNLSSKLCRTYTTLYISVRMDSECGIRHIHQWRSFKLPPSGAKCPGSGTEIIPGKHSDTRIKPLPLTNGHGRYITVTPERTPASVGEWPLHISNGDSSWTPGVFCTCFYNYARRLRRLEKLLYLELSRSSNGFFKVLLYPGGGFTSENATRRFQK